MPSYMEAQMHLWLMQNGYNTIVLYLIHVSLFRFKIFKSKFELIFVLNMTLTRDHLPITRWW